MKPFTPSLPMRSLSRACTVASLMAAVALAAAEAPSLPDWTEFQSIVRSNLPGLSADDWNRVQVQGVLDQLKGEVVLVGKEAAPASGPSLGRSEILEENYGYIRAIRVDGALAASLGEALNRIQATNKLQGVVLDLRFAGGADYGAAATVADRFIAKDLPLLEWGGTMARAGSQTNDVVVPVAVLVNGQTSGAAEALAEVLRESKVALLLGAPTAGRAFVFREFTLSGGQILRVASSKVKLASGEVMPASGLKPDIEVAVKASEELAWYDDPWKPAAREVNAPRPAAAASTNAPPRRVNEAELMRQRREESGDREPEPPRVKTPAPVKPAIQDPALARAVDLLKGLAILRQSKVR